MERIARVEPGEIDDRLATLDLTREQLMDVVMACVAARVDCTENDPPSAPGLMTWKTGTRRFREILRPHGWEKDDTANFSTIVNHKRRLRIAMLNSDDGAGDVKKLPRARSKKGVNAERVVDNNFQMVFPGFETPDEIAAALQQSVFADYSTWYLAVYIEGDRVCAELSLPVAFASGNFTDWKERIILIPSGVWNHPLFDEDDLGPDVTIDVMRK
jgi:hypothetical protein